MAKPREGAVRIAFTFALLFVACSQPPQEPKTDDIDVERILEENRLAQEKHERAMAEMKAIMDAEKRAEAELAAKLTSAEARNASAEARRQARLAAQELAEERAFEGSINDPAWRSAQDARIRAIEYREHADRIRDFLESPGAALLSADDFDRMLERASNLDRRADQAERLAAGR